MRNPPGYRIHSIVLSPFQRFISGKFGRWGQRINCYFGMFTKEVPHTILMIGVRYLQSNMPVRKSSVILIVSSEGCQDRLIML